MKFKKNIFFGLTLIGLILLSVFAHKQNKRREIGPLSIVFKNNGPKFLSLSFVNKLLIQNIGELSCDTKDSLDLSSIEALLESTPYILNAEVFCFPEGIIGINILEKEPIVMIQGDMAYYLDIFGSEFPISDSYSPSVPIYNGELSSFHKKTLLSLVNFFYKDPFLKSELKTIYYKSNSFYVRLKSYDFEVEIGGISMVLDKLLKLKVFCAYQDNNELEKKYKLISLKFKNQIIGS
tara:strand:- start:244 stop:951 length:708 start_codon:yes stop_codon:yes gene_type:complete